MEKLWRCHECDALLGVESRGALEIRHKGGQWHVRGAESVVAACVRCGQINERRLVRRNASL